MSGFNKNRIQALRNLPMDTTVTDSRWREIHCKPLIQLVDWGRISAMFMDKSQTHPVSKEDAERTKFHANYRSELYIVLLANAIQRHRAKLFRIRIKSKWIQKRQRLEVKLKLSKYERVAQMISKH